MPLEQLLWMIIKTPIEYIRQSSSINYVKFWINIQDLFMNKTFSFIYRVFKPMQLNHLYHETDKGISAFLYL